MTTDRPMEERWTDGPTSHLMMSADRDRPLLLPTPPPPAALLSMCYIAGRTVIYILHSTLSLEVFDITKLSTMDLANINIT